MKRIICNSILFLALLFLSVFYSAVPSHASATATVESIAQELPDYASVMYDSSNELTTSEANAVAQTGDGFIWIGSYSGLNRYDGTDFYRYDSSDGIASVISLYVDSQDRLWIGTNESGIAMFEDEEFRFWNREDGMQSTSVRSITEDEAGNIIFATTEGIYYINEAGELGHLDDERINAEYINEVYSQGDGIIYGTTLNGDVFIIKDLTVTSYYDDLQIGAGRYIYPDPDAEGYVYLGTDDSQIYYVNLQDELTVENTFSVAPLETINCLQIVEDNLWVCADNGIGYLDPDGNFTYLSDVAMKNSVDGMIEDSEENLWFVSSRQGVLKLSKSIFTDIGQAAALDDPLVNSTCIYEENLYLGTDNGLIILDADNNQIENELTEMLSGIRVRCIKGDSQGNLWFSTYGEYALLCRYADGTYKAFTEEDGMPSDKIRLTEELSDGTIAVGARGGVVLLKDGEVVHTFDDTDGLKNTEILSICEGTDGEIYAGTDGGGLYVIQGDEVIQHYGLEEGLESEIILRAKWDEAREVFWLVTSNSIAYLKDGEITTLKNFPYSNNYDMYFSSGDGIWILSSNGIYVINAEVLMEDEEPEYTFYDTSCGLPCIATANSWSYLSDDGVLYVSGGSGVYSINIEADYSSTEDIQLSVPYIEADGVIILPDEDGDFVIPADTKRLVINEFAITFSLSNPRINYSLEGFDTESTSISKRDIQPVVYTNLSGGEYTFHMSVLNTMNGEAEKELSVTIIKEKAIYEHLLFQIVMIFIVVILVALIAFAYTRKKTEAIVKQADQEKKLTNQIIRILSKTVDMRDKYTSGHSSRVAIYSAGLAQKMGYSKEDVEKVYNIGLLHDIGKISVSDAILNKPDKLTPEEYEEVKQHAIRGYEILKEVEAFPDLALGAGYHHERYDGKGYPSGKKGEEIPQIGQIIAVADVFDAMNSTRPYRKRMEMDEIIEELKRVSGTQLNTGIVRLMIEMIHDGSYGSYRPES